MMNTSYMKLFNNLITKFYANNKDLLLIILIWLFVRLSILLLSFIFIQQKYGSISLEYLKNVWDHWDSPHYLYLAEHWYTNVGDEKHFLVFLPFYPLVAKFVNNFIGNYFLSACIVSNLSFISAIAVLYGLMQKDFDRKVALIGCIFFIVTPFSFLIVLPILKDYSSC